MTEGEGRSSDAGWPAPHPSPPLPPPREYGAPGTPPPRPPWLIPALVVAVVGVLAAIVLGLTLGSGDDDPDPASSEPSAAGTTPSAEPTPEPTAEPTPEPTAEATPEPTPTQTPTPTPADSSSAFVCWDGSGADRLADCSSPTGSDGLAWLFPRMADQRCGASDESGDAVLRVVCLDELDDGTRVQVGYFEWSSVEDGLDFYDQQGLERSDLPLPGGDEIGSYAFIGSAGGVQKLAGLYGQVPFSFTLTYPGGVTLSAADLDAFAPRRVDQVRGMPAS